MQRIDLIKATINDHGYITIDKAGFDEIVEAAQQELAKRIIFKYLNPFVDLVFMPNAENKSLQMLISETLRELQEERTKGGNNNG